MQAGGLLVLTITGGILAGAWRSLLLSFGQLNTGKFAVINRIERLLPVAIYDRVEGTQEGRGSQDLPHLQFQGGVATNDLLLAVRRGHKRRGYCLVAGLDEGERRAGFRYYESRCSALRARARWCCRGACKASAGSLQEYYHALAQS